MLPATAETDATNPDVPMAIAAPAGVLTTQQARDLASRIIELPG